MTDKKKKEKPTVRAKKAETKGTPLKSPKVKTKAIESKGTSEGTEAKQESKPKKIEASLVGTQKPEKKAPIARAKLAPRTYFAGWEEVSPRWFLVDATNQTLGRLSSLIAHTLMGKSKPTYTRFSNTGDFVVVINAERVKLTGSKLVDKKYQYHTNYPGGVKTFTPKEILGSKHPERIIEWAVYGMLPKGHMGRRWNKHLRVYVGPNHPHKAQKPEQLKLINLGIH